MTRDATTAFARTLVDEWVRGGVRHAVVAPGSRSAPLALALAEEPRIRLHVHLDERSAAFFALGLGRASGRPAVVVCTSGTAAANFHPAVLEASHGGVPLVVATADRPPELRGVGAGQTIDQIRLYGDAVRWFVDAEVPIDRPGAGAAWRSLAACSVIETVGPPPGPAHVNLPFREPLLPTGDPLVEAPGRPSGAPWSQGVVSERRLADEELDRLAARIGGAPNGVITAGWGANVSATVVEAFASAAGWPVLADAVSNLRTGAHAVSTYDLLLRSPEIEADLRPDLALRLGAPLTGKPANRFLAGVPALLVDPDRRWLDPARTAHELVVADAEPLLAGLTDRLTPVADPPACRRWVGSEARVRARVDARLDGWDAPFEGRIARDVLGVLPDGAALVVASSMPVRDLESFAAPRSGVRVHTNRGVNGIDGFVSTALGISAVHDGPTVALTGDLCFLHDSNGLLGVADRGLDAVFVVIDNRGGGIFSFLSQAQLPDHFETLFGTPQPVDLAALAAAYGVPSVEVTHADAFAPAVLDTISAGGVRVVLVRTDRADNVARHHQIWTDVAAMGG
ncbi:MAG: 2-succinyl-5-enolpyruvyl-6-hydroxy-3-cyclohexene-1-carboxylic-acid synthase [Acidimicrobiia bacterium]